MKKEAKNQQMWTEFNGKIFRCCNIKHKPDNDNNNCNSQKKKQTKNEQQQRRKEFHPNFTHSHKQKK